MPIQPLRIDVESQEGNVVSRVVEPETVDGQRIDRNAGTLAKVCVLRPRCGVSWNSPHRHDNVRIRMRVRHEVVARPQGRNSAERPIDYTGVSVHFSPLNRRRSALSGPRSGLRAACRPLLSQGTEYARLRAEVQSVDGLGMIFRRFDRSPRRRRIQGGKPVLALPVRQARVGNTKRVGGDPLRGFQNIWYFAAWSADVAQKPLGRRIIDEPVVLFRTSDGELTALRDVCPHRFTPLSMGTLIDDTVECLYHGLRFNKAGQCVHNPHSNTIPKAAVVKRYPVAERDGIAWIWMGAAELADESTIVRFPMLNQHDTDATRAARRWTCR